MIDWKRIKVLQDEIGKDDFPDIVEIFVEEVDEIIQSIGGAPDLETLGDTLHALKGSALNLGFSAFADLCQQGELRAADGGAQDVSLAPILQCYAQSKDIFLAGIVNAKCP
ncbi:HPt (histidine-containing phosphotransfer) domain-containing protein [Sulfitobacter undariae]|uniref:HPt (Histidine-containing phosphotransfer) domain-containing protein n=1 Tax=Sulfitobacter undariae TaxID=1563671 RepID=A0A7W6E3K4_9RHOB|nr:Hpt domain-containing protein [Sulfitobacter undariae]MBB3994117.1 HPt (histidine-containing phosphotransfer) domain-containing protein [Sulfitobacter undariae]